MNRHTPKQADYIEAVIDETNSDPGLGRLKRYGKLSDAFNICKIIDVIPHLGVYVVQGAMIPRTPCLDGRDIMGIIGARTFTTPTVGSDVLVFFPPQDTYGIILSVLPGNCSVGDCVTSEYIRLASMAGIVEDPAYHWPITLPNCGGVENFSGGRPHDVLPGDWGHINDLGVGLGIGRAMAFLRASDIAKIEVFLLDHMVRLFGYNFELSTAGSQEKYMDDEGEFSVVRGISPYPWEALGYSSPKQAALVDDENNKVEMGQTKAYTEPQAADQEAIWRYIQFGGYLGDVLRDYVVLPGKPDPETLSGSTADREHRGLMEIRKGLDGSFTVRSAKGISHEKTLYIPVPMRIKRMEDPLGDSAENYSGAQYPWDGEEPEYRDDYNPVVVSPMLTAMHAQERQAYLDNWRDQQAFKKHKNDMIVPTEEDLEAVWNISPATLGSLGPMFEFPLPPSDDVLLDHRTRTKFFRSRSRIQQLPDGSINIEDAYGSQILLTGGNISITCPGTIFLRPGKSLVALSPEDAIIRAGKNVDITSSSENVRIKAEHDLHLLAGNDESGSLLLESRGVSGDSLEGVTIKSAGKTVIWSEGDIYARSENDVMLDADGGNSDIIMDASTVRRRIRSSSVDEFVSAAQADTVINKFDASKAWIGTAMYIAQDVKIFGLGDQSPHLYVNGPIVGEDITAQGSLRAHSGREIPDTDLLGVGKLSDKLVTDYRFDSREYAEEVDAEWDAGSVLDSSVREAGGSIGNSDRISSSGFGFRQTYNTGSGFVLYEAPWQRKYRAAGVSSAWEEPAVVDPETLEDTIPYPGHSLWTEETVYKSVEEKFFDVSNDRATPLDYEQQTAEAEDLIESIPETGYLVSIEI